MTNIFPIHKPETASFDEFWKRYPRKRAKGAARKAFERIRWTPETWEKLLKALEWQAREWTDPQFIPHPSTYLNQERWEDEPDLPPVICEWTGCNRVGAMQYRNGLVYCQAHIESLERGETPVGR